MLCFLFLDSQSKTISQGRYCFSEKKVLLKHLLVENIRGMEFFVNYWNAVFFLTVLIGEILLPVRVASFQGLKLKFHLFCLRRSALWRLLSLDSLSSAKFGIGVKCPHLHNVFVALEKLYCCSWVFHSWITFFLWGSVEFPHLRSDSAEMTASEVNILTWELLLLCPWRIVWLALEWGTVTHCVLLLYSISLRAVLCAYSGTCFGHCKSWMFGNIWRTKVYIFVLL